MPGAMTLALIGQVENAFLATNEIAQDVCHA
jgi:hypothetical protein